MKTQIILSKDELKNSDFKKFIIEIRLSDDCNNGHNDFAITGSVWYKDGGSSSGCVHEDILKIRPDLKLFIDLHLSDESGVPMHAIENGWYFYEIMKGEAKYHEIKTGDLEKYFNVLKDYLRIDDLELNKLILDIENFEDRGKVKKQIFSDYVETLKPRWKIQADKAKKILQDLINDNVRDSNLSASEINANDFLNETKSEISIKYLRNGKHFSDDKENCDIYEIMLKRGNRSYTFEFGQCLNDSGFKLKFGGGRIKNIDVPKDKRELFLKNNTELNRYIKMNIEWALVTSDRVIKPKQPTTYDVLACLTKYNPGSFEDFCSEIGYDADSKKADKIYNDVVKEYQQLCSLYSDEELELLKEIN